jgi:hypothetical protein
MSYLQRWLVRHPGDMALASVLMGALCLTSSPSSAASPKKLEATSQEAIHLAKLTFNGRRAKTQAWSTSDRISTKKTVRLIVLASWCPHSQNMITALVRHPELRSQYDFLVLADDETDRIVETFALANKISMAKAQAEMAKLAKQNGVHLFDTKFLADSELDFYISKVAEYENAFQGYPALVACTGRLCRSTSVSESQPIIHALNQVEKESEENRANEGLEEE